VKRCCKPITGAEADSGELQEIDPEAGTGGAGASAGAPDSAPGAASVTGRLTRDAAGCQRTAAARHSPEVGKDSGREVRSGNGQTVRGSHATRAPAAPGAGPGSGSSVGAKARRMPPGKRLGEVRPDPQVRHGIWFFYETWFSYEPCSKTEERYSGLLFLLY
jgi:hypothetical protein